MNEKLGIITLEDDKRFVIIDEIDNNGTTYVYLANYLDAEDLCIRKIENTKNGKFIVGLDSEEELDKALFLFSKKNS